MPCDKFFNSSDEDIKTPIPAVRMITLRIRTMVTSALTPNERNAWYVKAYSIEYPLRNSFRMELADGLQVPQTYMDCGSMAHHPSADASFLNPLDRVNNLVCMA
jgi:hypothetical protein